MTHAAETSLGLPCRIALIRPLDAVIDHIPERIQIHTTGNANRVRVRLYHRPTQRAHQRNVSSMESVRDDIDGEALSAAVVELQDLVGVALRIGRVQGRQDDRHSKGVVQGRTGGKTEDGFVSVGEEDQELV